MNRSTETTAPDNIARIARAAWLCPFVVPLILAMLLLGVGSAQAAPSPPSLAPLAFEEEEEFEEEGFEEEDEGEFAEEECEIAQEEFAEGEIDAAEAETVCAEAKAEIEQASEKAGHSAGSASRCPLRSARVRAVEHRGRIRLTIGYTTEQPFRATIQARKGSTGLGSVKRRLGRSGVVRLSRRLGRKASGKLVVRIRVPKELFRGRGCGLVQVVADKVV